ncbi:DMT family transporter [Ruegeria marina]|uniref:EamA-like transporter family protein n=1 Tax=Ruegeria marina TaxID=639004 RepID=A0A1G6L8A4_9RHOB|nr:DMT family transporter [Ruegeria marina]SDC39510.1 EamA-like transporter family protein [Ruegeria marina]
MQAETPSAPIAAAVLMVAAMAIIGIIDNYVIRLAETIGLWQFHFTRAVLMLPLVALMSVLGLGSMRPRNLGWVGLRSLFLTVAMLFYFSALSLMSIAEALAGLFTSPIFVLLIAAFGLRQRIGPWRIVAVMTGFAGILLVLQPDPATFDATILVPVAGGFFYALGAVVTRAKCAQESTAALLAAMVTMLGLTGLAGLGWLALFPATPADGAAGFVTRGWVWPMTDALPWVTMQAVGSATAVFMLIKAYQLGEPSYVSVFEFSVMIFGPLFAWVVFGIGLGPLQIAGIGLIVVAGAIIALRSG